MMPDVDEWDRPPFNEQARVEDWLDSFRPRCYNLQANQTDAQQYWMHQQPAFVPSIAAASDYKSVLDARWQGFIMEQNLMDIEYSDATQRFELCTEAPLVDVLSNAMLPESLDRDANSSLYQPPTMIENELPLGIADGKGEDYALLSLGQDVDTFCMELEYDLEEMKSNGLYGFRPDLLTFHLHFAYDLQHADFVFGLPWDLGCDRTWWTRFLRQFTFPLENPTAW